jgi:hypothetical protein
LLSVANLAEDARRATQDASYNGIQVVLMDIEVSTLVLSLRCLNVCENECDAHIGGRFRQLALFGAVPESR